MSANPTGGDKAAEFLWFCLKESGYKKIDFQKVGEALNITGNAASLRFGRLRKAAEEGKPIKNDLFDFLKLCITHSDVGKINFHNVGVALGITANAASLRYGRLRKKVEESQDGTSPVKSTKSTPVKKTPTKAIKAKKTPTSKRKRKYESDADDDITPKGESEEEEAKAALLPSSPPSAPRVLRDRSGSAKPKYAMESEDESEGSEWKGDDNMTTTPSKKKQKIAPVSPTETEVNTEEEVTVKQEAAVEQETTGEQQATMKHEVTVYEAPTDSYGAMVGLGDTNPFYQTRSSFIVDGEEVFYDAETGQDVGFYGNIFQEEYI